MNRQSLGVRELAAAVAIDADEIGVAEGADGLGAITLQTVPQITAGEAQEDGRSRCPARPKTAREQKPLRQGFSGYRS